MVSRVVLQSFGFSVDDICCGTRNWRDWNVETVAHSAVHVADVEQLKPDDKHMLWNAQFWFRLFATFWTNKSSMNILLDLPASEHSAHSL